MHDLQTFEARLGVALGRFADQVPTDVDASAFVRATRSAPAPTVIAWRTVGRMRLAVLLGLLVATGSGALYLGAGQGPSPVPTTIPTATPTLVPTEIADGFLWPFEYTLPSASQLVLTRASMEMYAFTEGSTEAYPDEGALQVRGVTVTHGSPALTHGANGGDDVALRPEAFLTDLRVNPNLSVGAISPTVVGGLPATQAAVEEQEGPAYPHVKMDGDEIYVQLGFPGRLIVADVDGASLLVHIWAGTDEELADWLPIATEFVDSIRFMQSPSPSASPDPSPVPASAAPSPRAARFAGWYEVMSPGRYVMPEPNTDGVGSWPVDRVIVTVPEGWTQRGPARGGRIHKGAFEDATAMLAFGRLGSLDPGPDDCPPPDLPGQTVDDLTTGLLAITDVEIADVAIKGYVGKRVEFTIPDVSPHCRGLFGWSTPSGGEGWTYPWDPDWHHQLSILDIDGVRFLIDASYQLDASPEVRAEVQAIVDSIELVTASPNPTASQDPAQPLAPATPGPTT